MNSEGRTDSATGGHGGRREGSGRKRKDPTTTIRVPVSEVPAIQVWMANRSRGQQDDRTAIPQIWQATLSADRIWLPRMLEGVSAGFASPASDYVEQVLDLNELLIQQPTATFLVAAAGWSMLQAGIAKGDILVVDRSLDPLDGDIVIAVINGVDFTCKRLMIEAGEGDYPYVWLKAENPDFQDIRPIEGESLEVWGVVTSWIKTSTRRKRTEGVHPLQGAVAPVRQVRRP